MMLSENYTVFIVDDDPSMQNALKNLLRSVGIEPRVMGSAEDFLQAEPPKIPSCLILDVHLPGLSGLALQRELSARSIHIPIIFITGRADREMSARAIKAGAVACLNKPFRDQDLLDAIQVSLEQES
jgi:FixJ family two-component response regulator